MSILAPLIPFLDICDAALLTQASGYLSSNMSRIPRSTPARKATQNITLHPSRDIAKITAQVIFKPPLS
jgi:hypothetical protein